MYAFGENLGKRNGVEAEESSSLPTAPAQFTTSFGSPPVGKYGENDLIPGGAMNPAGSSLVGPQNFRAYMRSVHGEGEEGGPRAVGFHPPGARYNPMFTGDEGGVPSRFGRGPPGVGAAALFPGEPDNDLLPPPSGFDGGLNGVGLRGGFGFGGAPRFNGLM